MPAKRHYAIALVGERSKRVQAPPPDQATVGQAEIQIGNGETYDFDFVPSGDLHLDVMNAGGVLLVSLPIRVR